MARSGQDSLGLGLEPLPLPGSVFKLLRDLIESETGVYFDDGKRGLLALKLTDLAADQGLTSFLEYYYLLRYDDSADEHWLRLMDRLAVPETYFWRQPEHFLCLARTLLPALWPSRASRPVRIWSAGCCTGEEPVSIAIALAEEGRLTPGLVEIVGTDGSEAMLEAARVAQYRPRSFRQLSQAMREKYFVEQPGGTLRPIDRILSAISYSRVNLADRDEVVSQPPTDVIFCRNVFIYFSDDAIRETVGSFGERLADDGYLFVGASESLTRIGVDFELAQIDGSFVYVRPGQRAAAESLGSRPARNQSPVHGTL